MIHKYLKAVWMVSWCDVNLDLDVVNVLTMDRSSLWQIIRWGGKNRIALEQLDYKAIRVHLFLNFCSYYNKNSISYINTKGKLGTSLGIRIILMPIRFIINIGRV